MRRTGVWEDMPEVDFVGKVCGLPVSDCSTDRRAPKLNPRPLAHVNRFPGHEEGRWGRHIDPLGGAAQQAQRD